MADPFELTLRNAPALLCGELVRELPGKRRVWRGVWQGRGVYAKLFLDPGRAAIHQDRERRGIVALDRREIATARLLHAGETREGEPILLLEEIADTPSLRQALDGAGEPERESLLGRMVALLAEHHRKGICQTDLHQGNFLVSKERIFTLDGAGVKEFPDGSPVPVRSARANLALFLAQFAPSEDRTIGRRIEQYLAAGGNPGATDGMEKAVVRAREERWREYRGKLTRECTAFSLRRDEKGFCLLARQFLTPAIETLAAEPDRSFSAERVIEQGSTDTIWWTPGGESNSGLLVKRYNPLGGWQALRERLRDRLGGGRALHSWIEGHRLRFFGLAAPRLYGLAVRREGLDQIAWLIGERIEAPTAREWFLRDEVPWQEKKVVARRIADLFAGLHRLGIAPGELGADNLLLPDGVPTLVDLDAMRRHRTGFGLARAWRLDLRLFMESWNGAPEIGALFEGLLEESFGGLLKKAGSARP